MPQCVGLTAKQRQCKTSGLYRCAQCSAHLCSWHVNWNDGAWCPWCKIRVEMRSWGGWPSEPGPHIERVGRGLYQMKGLDKESNENMDR